MRLDYQILLKSPPPQTLLAGSTHGARLVKVDLCSTVHLTFAVIENVISTRKT